MNYEVIIVRYGEIGLKAKPTRKRFENTLINNIKNALKKENISNKIIIKQGRIYITTIKIIEVMRSVFIKTSYKF